MSYRGICTITLMQATAYLERNLWFVVFVGIKNKHNLMNLTHLRMLIWSLLLELPEKLGWRTITKTWAWESVECSQSGEKPSNPAKTRQNHESEETQLKKWLFLCEFWYFTHHDCPLPVLCFRENEGVGWVENLVIHFLLFSRETMQEGPARFGHACRL